MTLVIPQTPGRSRMQIVADLMTEAQRLLRAEELERQERQRNFKVVYS
jgi:hypothetical protein